MLNIRRHPHRAFRFVAFALVCIALDSGVVFSGAQSPDSGRISGAVRQGGGEAVSAAIVVISSRDGRIQRTTRTNAQGRFVFAGLPEGSYLMQGCAQQSGPSTPMTVELKIGTDVTQDLRISNEFDKTADASCNIDSISDSPIPRVPHEYTGELISLNLQGDIKEFFRWISSVSGLELDVAPSINRMVAVHLKNIPWDLALDVVVRTTGLGSQLDGRVLHIATANPALGQDRVLLGTVTIQGKISGFTLQNPRTQLEVNAPQADGTIKTWPVEWESAEYLRQIGIRPNTLTSGDQVIVTGNITPANKIRLVAVQRPSDGFSWGYLSAVRAAVSDGLMFVSSTSQ